MCWDKLCINREPQWTLRQQLYIQTDFLLWHLLISLKQIRHNNSYNTQDVYRVVNRTRWDTIRVPFQILKPNSKSTNNKYYSAFNNTALHAVTLQIDKVEDPNDIVKVFEN